MRVQYESSQTTDHYPDLVYYGQYWWNPATQLNWMETVIGQHVWLSGPEGYLVAGTVNDFEYKDSGIFMDALTLGAGGIFLQFPGNWGCDPWTCLLRTGLDFEAANSAPTLMTSDALPDSTFLFPPELMRHEGDITIEGDRVRGIPIDSL